MPGKHTSPRGCETLVKRRACAVKVVTSKGETHEQGRSREGASRTRAVVRYSLSGGWPLLTDTTRAPFARMGLATAVGRTTPPVPPTAASGMDAGSLARL
jgi:hypothetical protein